MRFELSNRWDALAPRTKLRIILGGIVAAIVIPTTWVIIYKSIYSATITLTFAPKSASVTIGGRGARFGENAMKPGTYEVVISKQGFATYKETVSVKRGETASVEFALNSNDASTANWYEEHPDDYAIAQGISDRAADRASKRLRENFPIATILPIVGMYSSYRVDYGLSPTKKNSYAVYISYNSDTSMQQAIDAVEAKGYDLAKYEVVYEQTTSGEYGDITLRGFTTFTEKGLSSDTVDLIMRKIADHFTTYNTETVVTISVEDEVVHVMSDDKLTDTYITNILLNEQYTKKVTVAVTDYDHVSVQVSDTNGSSVEMVYDGKTAQ
jgi:hypothetical protein